ncbi:MAG: ribosome recycling factor [Bacteroidales bacterium]|jgi:ribosome recycling factor|nr:ribosome recycling factor [Bacteroidales bacterium]MCB9028122.1 ribosome recycling factor [Bacteroidales bacterium]MDD3735770.1 ribosome recycling factor [Bacteroidales bacterium]HNT92558.1 ribosome recycling factor [Bacteroidales bacterium]HOO66632.1 ribosome recycling factor [Bacteroidales bacterium]
MTEELELFRDEAEERMDKAVQHLEYELSHLRAGRANPLLLDGISVEYYGTMTPLAQVSNINTPDAKSILVQPWEKNMLGIIEKAILAANIGMTPINNGEVIRINVPPLTEERRQQLVKQVKQEGETAKISIRSGRKWFLDELRTLLREGLPEDEEKNGEKLIQEMTDRHIARVDRIVEAKEKEIMTV